MDAQVKTQVVERIRQANNILVSVSSNPTVDQLASCIGLTLLLSRLDKHATAVFSGKVPPMLKFLEPDKVIEPNTDSLQDFIISLDKNKADKLRYKVEDQFVRIFITPYKTSLSENDLEFSQGDFNVEVVIALGVKDKAHIDAAITAHGKILHDATVITVNNTAEKNPDIGHINWVDTTASSLSEMIVGISEAFGSGLIDNQMANAFLTGIVAETERFKNTKTTPKVMTIAAQLMAAGANQQLIVSKLEPATPPPLVPAIPGQKPQGPELTMRPVEEGTLSVSHKPNMPDSGEIEVDGHEIRIDEQGNLKRASEVAAEPPNASQPQPQQPPAEEKKPPEEVGQADQKTDAETEKNKQADEADKKEEAPSPHQFLGAKSSLPAFSAAGSEDDDEQPVDPLAESKGKGGGLFERGQKVIEPKNKRDQDEASLESARNAVENAFEGAPSAASPETIAKVVEAEKDKVPKDDDKIEPPAPPPVPPPLTLDPAMFNEDENKKK